MALSALHVKNAKPGRHPDGKGLYLLVSPTGGKSWVLRVQVDGKRKDYGLGSLDSVTLAEAREKASDWRKLAKGGLNPSIEAKRERGRLTSFKIAAEQYHGEREDSWKNEKHRDQWINTLRSYAYPVIGEMSVDRIDADHVAQALLTIWQTKPETARRVRQRIGTVLDYSKAKGWRATEAPMRAVSTLLNGIKQPKGKNFPAMPYGDVPAFISVIREGRASPSVLALEFLILTAARSGEVRGATWKELDLIGRRWIVPAERMKMGQEHVVPLTERAVAILEEAKAYSTQEPNRTVFPGLRHQPLSDMTLSKVLRTKSGPDYTVHGFRSSFRDWCAEKGFSNDWAEAALSHTVTNRVEAAYRRTKFFDQRVGLMDAWADHCLNSKNSNKQR
ncbi:tyrosine-type recombinase/integrase [Novosphingobium resinovorum]|uniref:tyrosine-type recombinase/integrase n=1 Tax=Novosphingobium TaxID=165696 RepID=UPI001B3C73BF|nr:MULTISPECIES: site-specific integrase [Novosphingobium]WJM28331.1 tyrosine-type recombinase/integrase [Novosphingobium resinovorum]